MPLLTDEVRAYIGREGEPFLACDAIEPGAVRRYAQAIMDPDPAYASAEAGARYGGAVAPPLYPSFMFRTPFGAPDVLTERAHDPDFDGIVMGVGNGLPELPLHGLALLNGGAEVEFFAYARHGERVLQKSRYADIQEKETRSGPMLLVIIETEFTTEAGQLLLRARKTIIRR
ncbi:MaoC family dehydratase N-terminal domain-containing protein [Roseomonas sp. SSH11]|uniref:MaoC family dehydratase N-terminal domain-containing protein n=1 Tax=Pararoseomonas baculiformis TaxID=2820812 RepID=A0ABS4AAB7_9PROT|nr:MaoC family dehydratase N-terminal domain-containing protein [Pararoseomonas baculiformis]MBP0443515.1 MaoC family dehydratase N-terminal domain-containing protein [Pararoseomonas baculiformis]